MAIAKAWQDLTPTAVAALRGHLGVYELGDANGAVVLIGFAGGSSPFGLRGELVRHLDARAAARFRVEVTMAYWSRYKELLMLHRHECGRLPAGNRDDPATVGRLSPG